MIAEPIATALLLVVAGVLLGASVIIGKWFDRFGVPVALLFLILGVLAGSEGVGRIPFDDYALAYRLGTIALVLILFDGGLNTRLGSLKRAVGPASLLATLGVAVTAALVALFARLVGLPWGAALLIGAVVSSTDAAAVFAILRGGGIRLRDPVGSTLELESGVNDPMAVILTAAITMHLLGQNTLGWGLAWAVPYQLVFGAVMGVVCGYLGRVVLLRVRVSTAGLFPALTLGLALLAYGAATLINASGFLAVYVAALVVGNGPIPYANGLRRIHDAIAWLAQIGMFLMLGMLVFPSQLLPNIGVGLAIALFLAFVARPAAVLLCLWPFRFKRREVGYVSWVGLRGAVPIILATFPVLRGAPGAIEVFNIVFFVVLINALAPGATVRWLTRKLGLERDEPPTPNAAIEINSMQPLKGEVLRFFISPELAACGAKLAQIRFPEGAAAVLIVRGDELVAAKGGTTFEPGDHVYVFCRPEDRGYMELVFGRAG
ncbi:MAG: potassium/proton antiporter [Phycisphaeraceae bacterium]|nr:potassium/proton antiporter [Phycisphaeraceae bacterium]